MSDGERKEALEQTRFTIQELLADLGGPTPFEAQGWKLIRGGKGQNTWLWGKYVIADHIRNRLIEVCSATGYSIVIDERWEEKIGDRVSKVVRLHILIHNPVDGARGVWVSGIGGSEPQKPLSITPDKAWKAAISQALKFAALQIGMGLDIHGESRWIIHHTRPEDGASTDDYGRRLRGR